jgi:putative transcriptional regulator
MTSRVLKESRSEAKALFELGILSHEDYDGMMTLTAHNAKIPKPTKFSGKKILRLRQQLHCSQRVFAEIVGVTADTVSKWERSERQPEKPVCRFLRVLEQHGLSAIQ